MENGTTFVRSFVVSGELEVYHSSMLKHAEKRRHFKYTSMQARTQLSIMDHNYSVVWEHATTLEGKNLKTKLLFWQDRLSLSNFVSSNFIL